MFDPGVEDPEWRVWLSELMGLWYRRELRESGALLDAGEERLGHLSLVPVCRALQLIEEHGADSDPVKVQKASSLLAGAEAQLDESAEWIVLAMAAAHGLEDFAMVKRLAGRLPNPPSEFLSTPSLAIVALVIGSLMTRAARRAHRKRRMQLLRDAEEQFRAALLAGAGPVGYLLLAGVLGEQGLLDEARAILMVGLEESPNHPELLSALDELEDAMRRMGHSPGGSEQSG